MPTADSTSTSRRLLALLSLLQARRDWPAPALARRLAVSERTVRRDIDRLRDLEYVIHATRGPEGGYRLAAGERLPPLLLDDSQAIAIALALRTAGSLGAGIDVDVERALAGLELLLPGHLTRRLEALAGARSAVPSRPDQAADPAVLLRVGEAIRTHRELRFDYAVPHRDAAEDAARRRVEPHHLLLHDSRWYLLAFAPDRDDWRTYRVDRITPRSHDGRAFTPRTVPGGDPAAFLAARFRGAVDADGGWPCRGTAVIRRPPAELAPYLSDGTAEAVGDDRSRVALGAWSWGALAAALARFDAEVSDAEPAELRAAFAELAGRAERAAAAQRRVSTTSGVR